MQESDNHVFNDDLLMNEGDVEFVRKQFPKISHVLNHPALKEQFSKYEKAANEARERVRIFGFTTVIASSAALLALATWPLWPHTILTRGLSAIIELVGMLAAIIAIGGLWLGSWKRRWLKSRLMTERLRQWHFQFLLRRGQQIEASCEGKNAIEEFQRERDKSLEYFLKDYHGKLDNQLESVLNDSTETVAWLHDHPTSYRRNSDVLHELFNAYELLRLNHQYGYVVSRLESTTEKPFWQFLKWPPVVQCALLSGVSSACFVSALILSGLLICAHVFGFSEPLELCLRTAAIVVALFGLTLRTVQDGLGLDGQIDRYRDYRERISALRECFRKTSDQKERFLALQELELASVQEMQSFMRTHQRAKFVLA